MRRLVQLSLAAVIGCVAAVDAVAQTGKAGSKPAATAKPAAPSPQPNTPAKTTPAAAATPAPQAQRPQFRPAVLLSGPQSLVNQIDTAALMKQGLKDGAVMFCSLVAKDGALVQNRVYRTMQGSEALHAEVKRRLDGGRVAPAIFNHQPVEVLLYGTVVFSIVENKPRLRVFLHQDPHHLAQQTDFIGPQPVFGGDSAFGGLTYPQMEHPVEVTGVVTLAVRVDAAGNLQAMEVKEEEPPLLGFGQAALEDFQGAKFIPAFRDGDPDAAETVLSVCYEAETVMRP